MRGLRSLLAVMATLVFSGSTSHAAFIGDIRLVYDIANPPAATSTWSPVFEIENTSGFSITGGVLTVFPSTAPGDSFRVGTVPAGMTLFVQPGVSDDHQPGHTFFAATGVPLRLGSLGPGFTSLTFDFIGKQGGTPVDSGTFQPFITAGNPVGTQSVAVIGTGVAAIPEPSAWLLAGIGLACVLGIAAGRRRSAAPS